MLKLTLFFEDCIIDQKDIIRMQNNYLKLLQKRDMNLVLMMRKDFYINKYYGKNTLQNQNTFHVHLIIELLSLILHIRPIYSIYIMIQKDDISINTAYVYVMLLVDTEEYILYMNVLLKVLLKRSRMYIKMILILFGLRNYMLIKELSLREKLLN